MIDLIGNKINNNGGDKTDYIYDANGKVVSSTSVKVTFSQGREVSSTIEGYGFRHHTQGTGGALYDPSMDLFQLLCRRWRIESRLSNNKNGSYKLE